MRKQKKPFICVESGEYFIVDAYNFELASEAASLYNGNCIKEISNNDVKKIESYDDLIELARG